MKKHVKNIVLILLGAFIYSVGVNYFAVNNRLAEGGFTGLALLAHYQLGISPALFIFLVNIPLYFIGYKVFGKHTLIYTLIGTNASSLFLQLTKGWGSPLDDLLLAALYTGVLVGVGLGLIFRVGGTTGGVDIIARLLNKYFDWSIGRTFFLFDLGVLTLSYVYIGREKAMYTMVAVFVGARVVDFVVEGLNSAKAATIISNSAVSISNKITQEMNRGATLLKGRGGYTGVDKEVLYVVVNRNELPRLKQIVHSVDPYAFVVVHDVRDVLGEGFTYESPEETKMQ
ncbi:YitT family protein [Polycladomyces subterraneus]|uniref:YitT family protein n=1 Tax=Polycladomyces subterraneus TaxID=1016997 RepID=A0ABT8IL27_9BACL|nr:YitT family protein [Polycladomyces subterraneus]MDN4593266.1 YitT family protein [Polycladomyces subterraneus]